MLNTKKLILYDNEKNPVAVQIPFDDYIKLEEIIESYGLAKLIEETEKDEVFEIKEALEYYSSIKKDEL